MDDETVGEFADAFPFDKWVEVLPGIWAKRWVADAVAFYRSESEPEGDEHLGHHRRGAPDSEPEQERPHHADDGA